MKSPNLTKFSEITSILAILSLFILWLFFPYVGKYPTAMFVTTVIVLVAYNAFYYKTKSKSIIFAFFIYAVLYPIVICYFTEVTPEKIQQNWQYFLPLVLFIFVMLSLICTLTGYLRIKFGNFRRN